MYTGNSVECVYMFVIFTVYPCVYRELADNYEQVQGRLRFIPVYTGNSGKKSAITWFTAVYPCVYRELKLISLGF